jgi:hypothetical protein
MLLSNCRPYEQFPPYEQLTYQPRPRYGVLLKNIDRFWKGISTLLNPADLQLWRKFLRTELCTHRSRWRGNFAGYNVVSYYNAVSYMDKKSE